MTPSENHSELIDLMKSYLHNLYHPQDYNDATVRQISDSAFQAARSEARAQYPDLFTGIEEPELETLRETIREEVYRRIYRDPNVLQLNMMRGELIALIRTAVEKEKGIIGTFYQNRGVHFRHDTDSQEYEDSPIVVIHSTSNTYYGGYEAATLYELFINADGKLLCTLNGEAGEDWDEPIENVQAEGLISIVQWLRENGFHTDDPWRCSACGSLEVESRVWANANTGENATGDDSIEFHCLNCDHDNVIPESEYLQRVEEWWSQANFPTMERITGLRQVDFSAQDGYQGFVDSASAWWEKQTTDQKIRRWQEIIYPEVEQ